MNNLGIPQKPCLAMAFDAQFAEVGEPCLAALRAYGRRHDIPVEFECLIPDGKPPSWAKITIIRRLFDHGYDAVAWIDADAFVQPDAEDIRSLFDGSELLIATHTLGARESPNCGVMMFRNTPWSHAFLNRLAACQHYTNHFWWENAALLEILGYNGFLAEGIFPRGWIFRVERRLDRVFGIAPAPVRALVRRAQARLRERIGWLPERWNHVPTDAGYPRDTAIIHLAGMPFDKKLEWVRRLARTAAVIP